MQIQPLFPTPIGFFDLDRVLSDSELEYIKQLPQRSNMGNTSSADNYILEHTQLLELKMFFDQAVSDYFHKVYSPKYQVDLRITQSWANYTNTGQFHHKHEHPNSFVSGVFYVDTDPEQDRIYFYRSGYQQIKFLTENWNEFNSESWWFTAEPNKLLLFPSHLTHMVETKQGENTRISVSFNTFPVGTVGDNQQLTELLL